MSNEAFRIIVIAGVFISIFASRANRLLGGIVSALVTTFILIFGLQAYGSHGQITVFGIPLSEGVFLLVIAVWYVIDFRQIQAGLKVRGAMSQIRTGAADQLRSGQPVHEIMARILPGLENHPQELRQVGGEILQGKPFERIVGDYQTHAGKDMDQAVLLYQRTVDVLNGLQFLILKEAEQLGIPRSGEARNYFLPAVKLTAGKSFSFAKKLLKGELVYFYNGKMVATPEDLANEASRTLPESAARMHSVFRDPRSGAWVLRKLDIKGGPLDIQGVANS